MIYDTQYIGSQIDVDSLSDAEESPWTIIYLVIMSTGIIIVLLNIMWVDIIFFLFKSFLLLTMCYQWKHWNQGRKLFSAKFSYLCFVGHFETVIFSSQKFMPNWTKVMRCIFSNLGMYTLNILKWSDFTQRSRNIIPSMHMVMRVESCTTQQSVTTTHNYLRNNTSSSSHTLCSESSTGNNKYQITNLHYRHITYFKMLFDCKMT